MFADLEVAVYGKEWANGRSIQPDARTFYYCAKRIYDTTDELVSLYQPDYITASDYGFICDSRRTVLLNLEVFKDKNKAEGYNLTLELEDYYLKIQGLFDYILLQCKDKRQFQNKICLKLYKIGRLLNMFADFCVPLRS